MKKVYHYNKMPVRTIKKDGDTWWVAQDVCDILGQKNVSMALRRLDADEKGISLIDTLGGKQQLAIVNEFGLYQLILSSRKQEARNFRRWVTHEVLPTIRQTGQYGYVKKEELYASFKQCISLVQQETMKHLQLLRKERTNSWDLTHLSGGKDTIRLSNVAKYLGWQPMKFFEKLRHDNVLMSSSEENWNIPYQEYLDRGYFTVRNVAVRYGGIPFIHMQPRVTIKGLYWLSQRYDRSLFHNIDEDDEL